MPTYDYECSVCGCPPREYMNVLSDSIPTCVNCGESYGMHRLPPRVNLGKGISGRIASFEDTTRPTMDLNISLGVVQNPRTGEINPAIRIRTTTIDNSPSNN